MIRVPPPTDHLAEIEERRRIAAELDAIDALKAERIAIQMPYLGRLKEVRERYNLEVSAISAEQEKAEEEIRLKLIAARDALRDSLGRDHPWWMRFGGELIRCALTGLPIHDNETVLEDGDGEQTIIRAVLFDDDLNFFERDEDDEDEDDEDGGATDADGEPF